MSRLSGGLIDRNQPLTFTFDGVQYQGFKGDTLASALLANGVVLMGRSFKYHRPRGPLTAGSEEPNAIVELGEGADQEPNTRATTIELFDGLVANSQNRWPSLKWDALSINDRFSSFFAAGFYYKTFMWPKKFWEKVYEPAIRKAAGLGSLSMQADPDTYDKGFLHTDLLIIGGGPAGLAAALTAGRAGKDVIIVDEDSLLGGRLNAEQFVVDGQAGSDWAAQAQSELEQLANVRVMTRSTVLGAFDHGVYSVVQRNTDHLGVRHSDKPRQTLWRVYSRNALLAAGATERPIAFENNDRPGILLASAMRAYANRWASAVGPRIVVFSNNDDGARTAADLMAKGVTVAAVIDTRADAPKVEGTRNLAGCQVVDSMGRLQVSAVEVRHPDGRTEWVLCDGVAVAGGWNPNVHLTCHQRGRPLWDATIKGFVPGDELPVGMRVIGSAAGHFGTQDAINQAVSVVTEVTGADRISVEASDNHVSVPDNTFYVDQGKGRAWSISKTMSRSKISS